MGFKTRCCSFSKAALEELGAPLRRRPELLDWEGLEGTVSPRGWGREEGRRAGPQCLRQKAPEGGDGVRTSLAQLSVQRSRGRSDVGDVCPCSVWEAPGNFPAPPSAPLATGARGSWVHFPEKHLQRSQSYETTGRGPLSCRASVPLPFLVLAKGTVSSDTLQGMG